MFLVPTAFHLEMRASEIRSCCVLQLKHSKRVFKDGVKHYSWKYNVHVYRIYTLSWRWVGSREFGLLRPSLESNSPLAAFSLVPSVWSVWVSWRHTVECLWQIIGCTRAASTNWVCILSFSFPRYFPLHYFVFCSFVFPPSFWCQFSTWLSFIFQTHVFPASLSSPVLGMSNYLPLISQTDR